MAAERPMILERKGRLDELDRAFDRRYWQAQPSATRFAAAWEMVILAHRLKGTDERQLQLQRSVESFQRLPG